MTIDKLQRYGILRGVGYDFVHTSLMKCDDGYIYKVDEVAPVITALEAELSAARGEIEHKRESISMLVLDAKRLEDENERLKSERLDFENREGAICPEDVGFEEYIKTLQKRVEELEDKKCLKHCAERITFAV